MVDNKGEGYKDEDKEKHVGTGVRSHREVNIEC